MQTPSTGNAVVYFILKSRVVASRRRRIVGIRTHDKANVGRMRDSPRIYV